MGFLGICFLLLTISGCNNSTQASAPKEKKLVIWHWMNDRQAAFNTLAQKYKAETGVTIEFKLFFPPDIYSQKVIAAARAGSLPEIFGILGEKSTMGSFIKAKHIADLTPYMEKDGASWKNSFYPQALDVNVFTTANTYGVIPGIYGVPIDTTIMGFVASKALLQKAGLDPNKLPGTFDEFVREAKTVQEKTGKNGFVCGWGEGWLVNCMATEWAINLMGEDKFIKTIKGEVPYTDKDWLEVFTLFVKLKDAGILNANITTMINKESEDAFSKEQAAFSFNGSWSVNVYKQLNPDLEYSFFALPKISNNFPVKLWGGAGSSFMVNNTSPLKEEAVNFLKWITAKNQQDFLIIETNNLPSIKGCEKTLPPILSELNSRMGQLTHPNIWPCNEDSRVLEIMNQNLQQIVMGVKKPRDAAKEIQEVKERVKKQ
jgi:ABC-type glycerol-3-phosphate transport system substrate-binding protein